MRRILVVDDDRHTRLAIGIWLKQCGFRVAITDGGESGLAALNDGTFDLMIVDVFMPNMRGFESIRVFHSHAPTVPLIAISGYAFSGAETDDAACFGMALSLGATRCLRKPFRPATLLGVIDECLSDAEQGRKYAAALAATASAPPNIREREREQIRAELPGRGHAAFAAFVDPDVAAEATGTSH
jgi:CheY-like chemotaxis protein